MTVILLLLTLALGGAARFYHNTAVALWHDEAFSALYLRYDWGEMMYRIGLDVHPPLYYIILRFWSYFAGTSLLSLRLLSIIFGVLTVWAGYLFIKSAFGNKTLALFAALALAVNPFQIQYSLEARMYTLGTFLVLLSSYLLTRAFENRRFWLWYALAVAAGLYTHYYLIFAVAAQGLFVLLQFLRRRDFKMLLRAAGSYLLAAFLFAPWLPTFLTQIKRVEAGYWIPPLDRWSVPGTIWKMIFGGQGSGHVSILIATAVALLLTLHFLRRVNNFNKWHVFLGLLTPFAASILLSYRSNLYLDRYFVFAALYFVILLVIVFYNLPRAIWRWSAISLLIVFSLYAYLKNWAALGAETKPGMAAAGQYLNANTGPRDRLYVGSSFIFFTFEYYNHTPIRPLLISDRPIKDIPHFSGTAILTDEDLILNYQTAPKNSTIWLLWTTGFGGSKPAAPGNWQQQSELSWPDTPGFKGQIYVTKYKIN